MRKHKRTRFFIDRSFQTKYILLTIMLLLVYSFLLAAILFIPYIKPLYSGESLQVQANAARQILTLHQHVWPAIGAVILILGGVSVFISHKVAGPVYRLKKTLAQATGGDLDVRIRLRKQDDLQDLAEHVNMLLGEMGKFAGTLKETEIRIGERIRDLERGMANSELDEFAGREMVDRLKQDQEKITAVLNGYGRN